MKLLFRIGFVLYVLVLIYVYMHPSLGITSASINQKSYRIDYFLHALAFVPLPLIALLGKDGEKPFRFWFFALLLAFLLALSLEFFQQFIPGRKFNPKDILSNCVGFTIGLILVLSIQMYKKKTSSNE